MSTATQYGPAPAKPPPPPPTSTAAPVVATPVVAAVVASSPPPPPPPAPTTSQAPVASAAPVSSGSGVGVAYNPYNADGTCKSQPDVANDIGRIHAAGYREVRIYGVDCNGVDFVYPAVKANAMTLIVGVFDIYNVAGEVASIVASVKGDWSAITACLVGNEKVNTGTDVGTVLGAVGQAKALLRNAGFGGYVATADTLVATIAHPALCTQTDGTPCYVNDHPFFNPNVAPSGAGASLLTDLGNLRAVLANPSQRIIISETGWPTCGGANGAAVPSPANQAAALASIKAAFAGNPGDIYLLTPMSSAWKNDFPGSFGAEKCWGFMS